LYRLCRRLLSGRSVSLATKLTAKQQAFCEEYLVDLNATQAAIRAGYSEKTSSEMGYENLSKPQIAEVIAGLQAKRSAETKLDAQWVLDRLQRVHDRCMQEEAVKDADGPTGEYKFEHSGANKSLELIGKHLAMFTEKKELTGANGGPIQTDSIFEFIPVGNDE
jgi:phage terminase small subunit